MNPLSWLRWRFRVPRPTGDQIRDLGQHLAWEHTPTVHNRTRSWKRAHGASSLRLSYATWLAESVMWPLAAESAPAAGLCLDRFFKGYWPAVMRELREDIHAAPYLLDKFDEGIEQLLDQLRASPKSQNPAEHPMQIGRVLAEHLAKYGAEFDPTARISLGLEYGHKLLACVQLLGRLSNLDASPPDNAETGT